MDRWALDDVAATERAPFAVSADGRTGRGEANL
jgi:hypothetical protein